MIILLSPAKTLDFKRRIASNTHSEPIFSNEADQIAEMMRSYSVSELMQVMKMSEKLAELSHQRFQDWNSGDVEQVQAGATFKGEAYNGLDMISLDEDSLDFAQEHLRILSGVYGVLRPYDIMKPYRLEMGSKLKSESLTKRWKEKLTEAINEDVTRFHGPIINLASNEYFSALDAKNLDAGIITPIFKEKKNGALKTIVVYTKKARGMMARYIIENRLTEAEEIKTFNCEGYTYDEELSSVKEYVFVR